MRKVTSSLALAALALAPAAQAQDRAAVYTPSGPWALDYGDDYCRLGRVFVSGSDQLELGIERSRPGPELRLWIVGEALRTFRGASEFGYTFLPSQSERSVAPIRAASGGVTFTSLPEVTLAPSAPPAPGAAFAPPKYDRAAEVAAAKGITAVALGKGLTRPVRFETGPMDEAIVALQACTDDLVKTWGVDPEQMKTLSAQPMPQGFPWLPAGTVPFGDFAKLAGNVNQVRVMVDASGKPTSCAVSRASLDAALNTTICQAVMEKASFTPAKDAGGQAVASYWLGSPMFMMPGPGGGRGGRGR